MILNKATNVKRFAALVLMICFFLPLSQCVKNYSDADLVAAAKILEQLGQVTSKEKPRVEAAHAEIKKQTPETDIYYPYKELKLNAPKSWLVILAFFFALPFLLFENKVTRLWKCAAFRLVELLASGWSVVTVTLSVALFYDPLIAGYFAITAISLYFVLTLVQLIVTLVELYKQRRVSLSS